MRPLDEAETTAVFEKLFKFLGNNLKHLVDRPSHEGPDPTRGRYCFRLHRNRVFYVSDALVRRATNISRDRLHSLGTSVGKFTHGGKFHLTVHALDLLAAHARHKVWLKPTSEMSFLYGNHVLKSGLARITDNVSAGDGVVVFSMSDLPLGFGIAAKSTQDCRKLDPNAIVVLNQEMIFRGTDTTALLTEWAMAELVLNQDIQTKLQAELDLVVGTQRAVTDADVASLPYLQAVVKEALRSHPPGPLLSWARLSTSDVELSNGMVVPAQTTAMVNMWAITHDPKVWEEPSKFKPERFLECAGGANVDVRGTDLRLAPFGAGRRVCPGKNLGLATVNLWVAKLTHHFKWVPVEGKTVDLSEVLKLSWEMKNPLYAVAFPRNVGVPF